jgi:hypothetical protein
MKKTLLVVEKLVIILIFCTSIYLPFCIGIFEKDADVSNAEKRKLSPCPSLPKSVQSLKEFPGLFEKYYADHFGLRSRLTAYYKFMKYKLGDSPSEHVTIGKEGWLFLGSIRQGYTAHYDPIGDYRNVNLYSQEELHKFAERMTALKSWLNKKGIEYVFVIAPSKHTVYYDKLPSYLVKIGERSATDQLVEYLRKHTEVSVVDPRQELIHAKNRHQVYYKTDTHWNHYGANIAQYAIMLELERLFPGQIQAEVMPLQDGMLPLGDLARMMGIPPVNELYPQPVFKNTCEPAKEPIHAKWREPHTLICNTQELNAVIFGDSFLDRLQPYFSRKFKRSTYIWQRLNFPALTKYIELEKPDVIIEEWVERKLPCTPKEDVNLYRI